MLKPMPQKSNNTILWIVVGVLILAGIFTLIISFSNANAEEDAIIAAQTNAAETVAAQQLTLQAASPTATPTVVTATPSATPTLFATNTLPVLLVSPTTSSGTGGSFAVGCDNSAYVADVTVPDYTAMTPGQAFKKTWKIQNTGTCPWTTAYKVTFLSGNQMDGVPEAIAVEVAAGQSADLSVNMIAPASAGEAQGYWVLANANGQQFGQFFYVLITVGGGSTSTAPTNTPTETPTP